MQLYELAMEMGVHSAELLDRARQLGMYGMALDTELTPDQVAALRGMLGTGVPTAPSWAAAPLAPPASPASPAPPAPPAPGALPAPPAPPPHWSPSASPGTMSHPAAVPRSAPDESRKTMLVGGAIVVAAIVGFVVFVTTQGDADRRDRRERAAAAAERAEDDLATRVEVNRRAVPDGFETPEPTSPEVADLDGWDRPEFCRAARSLMSFEKRGLDSGLSGDLDDYLATIVSGRDRWKQDVDAMIATDPPGMTDDLVQYRGKYERFLWSFSAQTAPEELEVLINEVYKDDFTLRAGRINRFVQAECG